MTPDEITIEEEYLISIVGPLVSSPVGIDRTVDERGVLLTMNIAKEDMGVIIGKKGQTAIAIRRLIRQFGSQNGLHVSMKINEPTV